MLEGAKRAIGLTVIIDVFRAFSTACYVMGNGANKIIVIGDIDIAYNLKKRNPDFMLIGERGGRIQPGFDYDNSPTQIEHICFAGKTVIQTTSAGTQGLVNANNANEVITGSFVNAQAIIDYIISTKPNHVSLVCMGTEGIEQSDEDILCAEYIKNALINKPTNFNRILEMLRSCDSAQKFFDPKMDWAPERDFELCLSLNRFPFILKAKSNKDNLLCLEKYHI